MDSSPLVSIIMPAYNAEKHIAQAIASVVEQSYPHWELLIVNDGSTDATEEIIHSFTDERIRSFSQQNKGVSAARNKALSAMKGNYFCCLDADDAFPTQALEHQVQFMNEHPEVTILGGKVSIQNPNLSEEIRSFTPTFKGNPLKAYVRLHQHCFFSVTGFIRRDQQQLYAFDTSMTHAEDLLFFISIAKNSTVLFDAISAPTYIYRQSEDSAMSNLDGLYKGYVSLYKNVKQIKEVTLSDRLVLKYKITKIMCLSYLKSGAYAKAFKSFFQLLAL